MKQTVTNTFSDGLNLDLHPIVTPNTVLTDNLNGTFITYNGNEFCLQNDRGNTEICSLPDGFIPIGAKEHGGIIYIVSTNDRGFTEIGTFPGIADWTISKGNLNYNYHSLGNLYSDSDRETPVIDPFTGKRLFRAELGYDVSTPVTIDVQDSYDGSVNLIILGGENKPIIINSGFSVLPENGYEIINRDQNLDTNKYSTDKLLEQIGLIRTSDIITNIDLHGGNDSDGKSLLSGGQLKGGNYKFYIKFGDADYNQTDVIAESSGMISIFNGKNGDASTISGTLLDERTDKMIGLDIIGLNHTYSKIYVYYSREYSDTNGYRMTEYMMLNNPIDMVPEIDKQTIWITGYEQEVPINPEELNVDYHTIDFAKAETQQANMLFLANIGKDEATFDAYRDLKNWTQEVTINVDCTELNTVSENSDLYSQKLYYDISNIYYNLGYYPGEIYRFGIVYIFDDNSLSPVFNVKGGLFKYDDNNNLILDHSYNTTNNKLCESGVIVMPEFNELHQKFSVIKYSENKNTVEPIYLKFTLPQQHNYSLHNVKGWFVVRQKRIPNEICQGLSAKIDNKSHIPVIYNGSDWITQSFLTANRDEINKEADDALLRYDNSIYMKSDRGMDWQDWLKYNGYNNQVNLSNIYLKKYSESINIVTRRDIKKRDNTGNNASKFNKIDAYYNGQTNRQFANSISNSGSVVYFKKYHLYVDGFLVSATKNGKSKAVEVTYISKSSENPDSIFIDPLAAHPENYISDWIPNNGKNILTSGTTNALKEEYDKYVQQFGGSVERKIIKEVITPDENDACFSSDALINLDSCVDPTIKSVLNGNKYWIEKKYDTAILSDDSSGYYEYYGNHIEYVNEEDHEPEGFDAKAVFIDSDTAVKVVDNMAYSNIAGDPSDVSKFSYFSSKCFVERKTYGNEPETNDVDSEEEPIEDYKNANNVNLIRGKFCPYIGIVSNEFPLDSVNIYSIKIKKEFLEQDIKVRSEDNSEYYCVSPRFNINDIKQEVYGGDCFVCTSTVRIIRNFIDPVAPVSENILKPFSWKYYVTYMYNSGEDGANVSGKYGIGDGNTKDGNLVDFTEVNLSDVNTVDLGIWVTFRTLSSLNLGLRSQDYSHVDEMSLLGSPRTFYPLNGASTATGAKMEESWLLNDGYNATVGRKRYNLFQDVPYTKSEFSNRIMFSNVNVTDAYTNGYRTFQGLSYKDYDKQYGEIIKLVPWGSNILCVMEHGIGLVTVNERALMQTTTGEAIHIYGHGVLPDNMTIISQDYGSKYPNSVIRTPIGVYGIDTDARKIWRVSDKNGFETISDMKIETYLNDNLFTDMNSIIETIDVRTHYNAFKGDVMFTFYNTQRTYLIVPEEIELEEGEEKLYEIKTNLDNVTCEILNSSIIEWDMKNNKRYIKGKSVGTTQINSGNNLLSKLTSVIVKPKSTAPVIEDKYLTNIAKDATIWVGESVTYNFTNLIDSSALNTTFDPNVIALIISNSNVTIQGINAGTTSVVFKYGKETVTCNVIVNELIPDEHQYIPPVDPEDPDQPVVPDVPIGDEYYTVYLNRPKIGSTVGEEYSEDCTVYLTINGTRSSYLFNSENHVYTISVLKNSKIRTECTVASYIPYDEEIVIKSDRTIIEPVLLTYVTLTINSVTPSNAEIKINDVVKHVGDVLQFSPGRLITVDATAEGFRPYYDYFTIRQNKVLDIVLQEGQFLFNARIYTTDFNPNGSHQTSICGITPTTTFTIVRDGESFTNTIQGSSFALKRGDSVYFTIYIPGYDIIDGSCENVQSDITNTYYLNQSDYYNFSVANIPEGHSVNLEITDPETGVTVYNSMWETQSFTFKVGTLIKVIVPGVGEWGPSPMPAQNVTVDLSNVGQ